MPRLAIVFALLSTFILSLAAFVIGRVTAPLPQGAVAGDVALARLEGGVALLQEAANGVRDKMTLLRDLEQANATVADLRRQLAEARALPPVPVPPPGTVLQDAPASAAPAAPALVDLGPPPEQVVIITNGRTLRLLPSGQSLQVRRLTADGALIGWRGGDQFLSLNETLKVSGTCALSIRASDGQTARLAYQCAEAGAGIAMQ